MVDVYDVSSGRAQELTTKNLQALESRWAMSQSKIQEKDWLGVQSSLARHFFMHKEPLVSLLGCRSLEDMAMSNVYYDQYNLATGHRDMSEVIDILAISWSTGSRYSCVR